MARPVGRGPLAFRDAHDRDESSATAAVQPMENSSLWGRGTCMVIRAGGSCGKDANSAFIAANVGPAWE